MRAGCSLSHLCCAVSGDEEEGLPGPGTNCRGTDVGRPRTGGAGLVPELRVVRGHLCCSGSGLISINHDCGQSRCAPAEGSLLHPPTCRETAGGQGLPEPHPLLGQQGLRCFFSWI